MMSKVATLCYLLAAAYATKFVSSFTTPTLQSKTTATTSGNNQGQNYNLALDLLHPLRHSLYQPNVSARSNTFLQSQTTQADVTNTGTTTTPDIIGTVALLVPSSDQPSKFGSKSPVQPPSYREAAEQLARKIKQFSDGRIAAQVVTPSDVDTSSVLTSNALIALGLTTPQDVQFLSRTFRQRRTAGEEEASSTQSLKMCQFAVDCGDNNYAPIVGPYDEANPSVVSEIAPWSDVASGKRLATQMKELFDKQTSDEFALALMLFFNRFIDKIPWVQHSIDVTWEKGLGNVEEIYNMVTKCGPCITKCLADENCKACIEALDEIDTRDQVASYRTVVSYESELLRDFSLCILQKNNIFGCTAEVPKIPYVKPLGAFRGEEMTKDIAKGIMIGHLEGCGDAALEGCKELDVSWKVACGANVAYDQFPSQNQLFYPSAKGDSMWYDPVFRVETIDGRNVWCKRHYRVRNEKVPGTFRFSVLDNGVTSDEFWTIVDVAEDLSWIVFHYAGAAGAVGQRYIGGLLCTPDGTLPPESEMEKIWDVLRSAEIEPWELFVVDNDDTSPGALEAGPPPLDFYRKTASVIG
mmetsp:Transcript_25806/g.51743  ORF Transcript_25806/g.51743 Transcript_25806/m.51743 type:complete len:581 (+) Transcript_25806:95-1837(+)|eukprot:CAMPEP_0113418962 /NCGR_PEP_ID=MMETSP0013_2-20120614/26504_1 /TAXON_ID=2843 ORGANISM="Skeletonema costatum, Strain 1716" /NCGR_SAMPLE_ID=MMETSP0013_2 /ASSEMBLY_ACC=CAM_ASM_000158 /LENGTH=580 /DNA_ID=CAMNT_0000306269 /DNA_START=75 /DNA_END=1820 /DNA_ORIENTATION=- /assembly_acc=CAM_ASM_000158